MMNLDFRWKIRKVIRKFGIDVVRYADSPTVCRMLLLYYHGINLIFDVGANQGQYAQQMRNMGFIGKIVSFEPLSAEYDKLKSNFKYDSRVVPVNVALGEHDGKGMINRAAHSGFSSMLNPLQSLVEIDRNAIHIGREEVLLRKIDSIIDYYSDPGDRLFLKIDTQGYEKNVMGGACASLNRILGVQMELSLVPLYEGEALLGEMIGFMSERGYSLMSLEPGSVIKDKGQMIQVEGIFFRP